MFPFKKKKKNEEEEPEKLEGLEPVKPVRRRRKKVEPPKPWGKLERIIVLLVLISFPLISAIFLIHSRTSKTAKQIQIQAPKIIQQVIPVATPDVNILKTNLENETANLQGDYGIWVQSVDNSYSLGINETDEFDGASLFKLPLMIAYYEEIENGNINENTNYTLKYSDSAAGAGVLATMPAGTVVTYKDMIEAIGKNSDNTAFSIMLNTLGFDKETNMISKIGMTDTDFSQSTTTPRDIGTLFYKLQKGELISEGSKKELLSFLINTDFENLIPAGVPENIVVAHKYGSDDGELNDAGIVYANEPYVLVVLAKNINSDEANVEIPKISRMVYNWLNEKN